MVRRRRRGVERERERERDREKAKEYHCSGNPSGHMVLILDGNSEYVARA